MRTWRAAVLVDADAGLEGAPEHGLARLAHDAVEVGVGVAGHDDVDLHAAGHRVLLPVCEEHRQLSWVEWTPNTVFHRSRFAPIDEPDGDRLDSAAVADAQGIFLPATAVDASGSRIGQGGGYYDRLLEKLDEAGRRPPAVAVVFSDEVLPAGTIPAEPLDRPVAGALTPDGEVRFPLP